MEVFINETTGDFVARTGQPSWAAAATRGKQIELQPIELLKRRRILETTVRHELVHAVIDTLSKGQTPRWLSEGMALYVAGKGPLISPYLPKINISLVELEQELSQPSAMERMRGAYAVAYSEVSRLIRTEGEASGWARIAR